MPKPSWKKLETYLVIAGCSAMIWLAHFLLANLTSLGLPPAYATIGATLLGLGAPALIGYFAKLRHQAYLDSNLPDPNPEDAAAQPVQTLGQAAQVLGAKQ